MLNPKVTNCKECGSIPDLIKNIDCKIAEISERLYNNIIFSLNLNISYSDVLDLLNYRRILEYKLVNPEYACEFDVPRITTRVKLLAGACKCKCVYEPPVEPEPVYISFWGRVGVPDCIDGFKTVLSDSTQELFKSTESYALGTTLYYSDKTKIESLLVLDIAEGLLLTTNPDGIIGLIEQNGEVPC